MEYAVELNRLLALSMEGRSGDANANRVSDDGHGVVVGAAQAAAQCRRARAADARGVGLRSPRRRCAPSSPSDGRHDGGSHRDRGRLPGDARHQGRRQPGVARRPQDGSLGRLLGDAGAVLVTRRGTGGAPTSPSSTSTASSRRGSDARAGGAGPEPPGRGPPRSGAGRLRPDGTVTVEHAESLLAQGVIVSSLEEAAVRHPDLVQRGLSGIGIGESYFVAMWNALWQGGVFITSPRDAGGGPGLDRTSGAGASRRPSPPTLVVVDDHARSPWSRTWWACLIPPRLSVAVTAFQLGEDARVTTSPCSSSRTRPGTSRPAGPTAVRAPITGCGATLARGCRRPTGT